MHQIIRDYSGGLQAENESRSRAIARITSEIKGIMYSGIGREVDLSSLLSQKRSDDKPKWTLIDPTKTIYENNGRRNSGYSYSIMRSSPKEGERLYTYIQLNESSKQTYEPSGIPPLPSTIRRLVKDKKIRSRANFVGVLYQPEEWIEVKQPDPAVVVEWKALPGRYFALAVWGGDKAEVEEFYL